MKPKCVFIVMVAFLLAAVMILVASPILAAEITIVGEVNDNNQIVAGGKIYEVDDTPEGNDLVANYISQRVKVTGSVRLEDGMPVMAVKTFEVVSE